MGAKKSANAAPSKAVPKRRRTATALARQYDDPLWQLLDEKVGGRDGMLAAALSSATPKAAILAELLADPAFHNRGTKDLARKAGLSAPEIVDLFRDKKWLETTLILHDKLPEIIDGATDDAKPKQRPCVECKGSGKSESGDSCWVCGGVGTVRQPGDKDKLQFVGEAVGMTGKRGPLVQVTNQQLNVTTESHSFEQLMRRATVNQQDQKQISTIEGEIVDEHKNN